jgi:GT2 family glycosyltransferase
MITLAVVTRDRPEQLKRHLLPELRRIVADGFPVIVVDQSRGEATASVLDGLSVVYERSGPGLSHGRNIAVGLTQTPLIAFTDDDVTPPPDWLTRIVELFDGGPHIGAVCGRAIQPGGPLLPGRDAATFRPGTSPFELGSGFNIAFRRRALEQAGPFDEELGAGARWRAAEDTDMLYRIMRAGWAVCAADDITVVHHDSRRGLDRIRLHYGYGVGVGAQTAKHDDAGDELARRIALAEARRHMGTIVRSLVRLQPFVAGIQLPYLAGLAAGYLGWKRSRRVRRGPG